MAAIPDFSKRFPLQYVNLAIWHGHRAGESINKISANYTLLKNYNFIVR